MLYLITGPAGVGKSTISKEIAKSSNKSVLLEGDDFYHHVVNPDISAWKEGNHLDIFWKVVVNTIKIYLDNGYDVVFNYIIDDKKCLELKDIFKEYKTKFVILLVDEKTIIERDNLRDEDCRMKDRCIVLLNNFLKKDYPNNNKLFTQDLTVEETVKEILNNDKYII